jgi:hypothetical protein
MNPLQRKLVAKVHIAKKELGLDDDVYQDVLQKVTGLASTRDMSDRQLEATLAEFKRLGWVPKTAKGKRPSAKPQIRFIWSLWAEMCRLGIPKDPTRAGLRAFVLRNTHVSDPEWLNPTQASAILTGLKAWKLREVGTRSKTTQNEVLQNSPCPVTSSEPQGVAR